MPQNDVTINGGKNSIQARQAALVAQVLGCSWEIVDSPVTQGDWATPLALIENRTLDNKKIYLQCRGVRELAHALSSQKNANQPIMSLPKDNSELCQRQLATEIESIFDRHAEPIISWLMEHRWAFSIVLSPNLPIFIWL